MFTFIVMYMNVVYSSLPELNQCCFDADCGIEIIRVRNQWEGTIKINRSLNTHINLLTNGLPPLEREFWRITLIHANYFSMKIHKREAVCLLF